MQNQRVRISSLMLCAAILITGCLVVGCGDAKQASSISTSGRTVRSEPVSVGTKPSQVADSDDLESLESETQEQRIAFVNRVRPRVEAFCGDCHAMPRPTSSTHEEWVDEVNQGFVLYGESGRSDLEIPPYDEVLKFFQYQAPTEHSMPLAIRGYPETPVPLRTTSVRFPGSRPPGVTNVRWIDIGLKDSKSLVYCDIGTGAVMAHWPLAKDTPIERLATLYQPVHVETCDLDDDGLTDLVVADIGEFNAEDSELGRVVWLRREPDSDKFERIVVQDNMGRVADVRPGDFDGDGDSDLLVAVFGWRKSGRIVLLENEGATADDQIKFKLREIDERAGAGHVPTVDLNGDGHLDFVALISQHHESVEAFVNDGTGNFTNEVIWAAPDPAYGSSGIELVDLDADGDLDVLYTNGDSFDRGPKPYHSVQWLENQGSYPYKHHHLCHMPCVLNATAGDFDGDGDLDVVAASIVTAGNSEKYNFGSTPSVVMLMQTASGKFTTSKVETGFHHHLSVESGDFNDDGKLDFAVGTFLRQGIAEQPDLVVWWNES